MMTLRRLIFDHDAAAHIASAWQCEELITTNCRASANIVYPFKRGAARFVLRYNYAEERCRDEYEAEVEFLQYLAKHGFSCARPVVSRAGNLVETMTCRGQTYHAVVFEAVAGRCGLDVDAMTAEQIREWGRSLGSLHRLSQAYNPRRRRRDWRKQLVDLEPVLDAFPAERNAKEELEAVRAGLSLLDPTADNFGLVHYDFETDNLIQDAATHRFTAIDFDDCVYHFFATDIVSALRALAEMPAARAHAVRNDFMNGYRSSMPIDPALEKDLSIFERYVRLVGHLRILHSLSDVPEAESQPDWMPNLRNHLDRMLAENRRFFASGGNARPSRG